jgi:hypothetical protein
MVMYEKKPAIYKHARRYLPALMIPLPVRRVIS